MECALGVMEEIKKFFELQLSMQLGNIEIIKVCILLVKMFDFHRTVGKNSAPKCAFLKASKFRNAQETIKEMQKNLPHEIRESPAILQLKSLASNLEWVADFNIGNIMHMKPVPPHFFSEDSFEKLQNIDSTIEIVSQWGGFS